MLRVHHFSILMGLLVGICLVASSTAGFAVPADSDPSELIAEVYAKEGGMKGWLGAAISPMMYPTYPQHPNKNRDPEHWRQDYEGGYISWSYTTDRYEAMPYFVRIEGDPRVYLVHYGKRRWIPEDSIWEEFCKWRGIDFAKRYVKVLKSPDVYPLDKPVDHLIRLKDTPTVYYVPRGTYAGRHVASPWALENWGLLWGDIIALSPEDMAKYTTAGPAFHPRWGGEARPKIEVLSYPKQVRAGRDIRMRWKLKDWFTDTDTELHYRVDGGMPQKTATQHGGNKRYRAVIPASFLGNAKQVEIWIRAAERGESKSSDDCRLEFWEPDVDAGFAPLTIKVSDR